MLTLDRALLAVTLCMALLGLVLSVDLVQALGAEPCSGRGSPGCYPWGAEGPAAGRWSYASKANYLLSGFGRLGLIIAALALLGWRFAEWRPLATIARAFALSLLAGAVILFFV